MKAFAKAAVRLVAAVVVILALSILGFIGFASRSEIPAITPAQRGSFDASLVKLGRELAAVGNCATCHTVPNGKLFAGGRALSTPFGKIYATNITPDPTSGIGRWSEAAFARALREGVGRTGEQLYPAFPYTHFTLLNDADTHALYAYVMSQEPVARATPSNELSFPYNIRTLIAGWKLLYFKDGRFKPDSAKGETWNRGAYLAEGLAHCGVCHTPMNGLGAEIKDKSFTGNSIEGWYAYAINKDLPAPVHWTEDALAFYLSHGWAKDHGLARGPMVEAVENLGSVPGDYAKAIAAYLASGMPEGKTSARIQESAAGKETAAILKLTSADSLTSIPLEANSDMAEKVYRSACANCHEAGRPLPFGALPLSLSTGLSGPTPQNAINVVLYGLEPRPGERSPIMPPFAAAMNNAQLEALLEYLRTKIAVKPTWPDVAAYIRKARDPATMPALFPSPGIQKAHSAQGSATW